MQVTIFKEQESWLNQMSVISGYDSEKLVNTIIKQFAKKNPIKEEETKPSQEPVWISSKEELCSDIIIKYYKEMYQKKFSISTDEKIDKKLVVKTFVRINNSLEDVASTEVLLKKAIAWYIFQHDNTTQDGKSIPFQFRILLEQNWLLKSCIENSQSMDIDMVIKAQEMNLTNKELTSAIKRGDVAGLNNKEDISSSLEEALVKVETFLENYEKDFVRAFKKHPKIKELYTSELPDGAYIRKAIKFLEETEATINE